MSSHHFSSSTKSPILTQSFTTTNQQNNEFNAEFSSFPPPSSNEFNSHAPVEFGAANLVDFNQSNAAYFEVNSFHQGNLNFVTGTDCNSTANNQFALLSELEWRNNELALPVGYQQPHLNYFNHHHQHSLNHQQQYSQDFQLPLNSTSTTDHSSSSLESQDTTTTASNVSSNSSNALAVNTSPLPPQQTPVQNPSFPVNKVAKETPSLTLDHQSDSQGERKCDNDKSKEPKPKPTIVDKKLGAKRPGRKPHTALNRPKKPEDTYIVLIAEAINAHETKRATLNEIYDYLKSKYEFFCGTYNGWQNSIRHNLSLNQCFTKLDKTAGNSRAGKGHYWTINEKHPITKPNNQQQVVEAPSRIKAPIAPKRKPRVVVPQKSFKVPRNFANLSEVDRQMLDRFAPESQSAFNSLFDAHSNVNNQMIQTWENGQMPSSLLLNDFNNYMLAAPQSHFYSSAFCWPNLNNNPGGQLIEGSSIENSTGLLIPATVPSNASNNNVQSYQFVDSKPLIESQFVNAVEEQKMNCVEKVNELEKKIKLEPVIPNIDSFYPSNTSDSSNNTASNIDAQMSSDTLHQNAYQLAEFSTDTQDFFAHQQAAANFHLFGQLPSQEFLMENEIGSESSDDEEQQVRYEIDIEDNEERNLRRY